MEFFKKKKKKKARSKYFSGVLNGGKLLTREGI